MRNKLKRRRVRGAIALTALALVGAMFAGTASGTTNAWQDVWAQIKPLLSDPGTINDPENPVSWTKLKSVPQGFADGKDNGVDRAGFGLTKNIFPNLEFAVDPSQVQRRVSGGCPAGQAVQSIAADGSVTCYVGPRAFSSASTNTGTICNDFCTVLSLPLAPGTYAVSTKINPWQSQWGEADGLFVTCELRDSDARLDMSEVNGGGLSETSLSLQGVVTLHGEDGVYLRCKDHNFGDAEGRWAYLTAIRVS